MKALYDSKFIILALLVVISGIALGSAIPRWLSTPPDNIRLGNFEEHFPNERIDVILLGTAWCPICAKTREFFADENIDYLEYDVDESEEGKALAIELGQTDIVPVILLRDRLLRGFNPDDLRKLLNSENFRNDVANAAHANIHH